MNDLIKAMLDITSMIVGIIYIDRLIELMKLVKRTKK